MATRVRRFTSPPLRSTPDLYPTSDSSLTRFTAATPYSPHPPALLVQLATHPWAA